MSGEFQFIESIRQKAFAAGVVGAFTGIGDDCAVIPYTAEEDLLVSTDLLVEGVHFLRGKITARDLGYKALAVNLSDIAAMGGRPLGTFLSIALPSDFDDSWKEDFIDGYLSLAVEDGAPLLGGDTTSSLGEIAINVCVLGTCQHGKAHLRSHASHGDLILCTGTLGDSGAGLKIITEGIQCAPDTERFLIDRHIKPTARLAEGLILSSIPGVHAMMDISDGVASDLGHILKESGVGAQVNLADIPVSEQLLDFCLQSDLDPVRMALCSGEDYELLFTAAPDSLPEIQKALPQTRVIGRITDAHENPHIEWLGSGGKRIHAEFKGFTHF